MAGQTEFDARINRIAKRAARSPAARAAAQQRRKSGRLHGVLGVPISALVGLFAGWGGMVAAHVWLRPYWETHWESSAEAPLAMISGIDFASIALVVGPALAILSVVLLGFSRFWHVLVAAACSVGALQAAPLVLDYWPEVAAAPPPDWMVAAFAA